MRKKSYVVQWFSFVEDKWLDVETHTNKYAALCNRRACEKLNPHVTWKVVLRTITEEEVR